MKRVFCSGLVILVCGALVFSQSKEKKRTLLDLMIEENYLGKLSSNPYDPESTSNPYGQFGSRYSPKSVTNPYSLPGQRTRSRFATTESPIIIGEEGTYLGRLNRNKFDPDSVSNPYGVYGSKYSPKSINNPYGLYGSPYSPYSATNPYSTQAPKLFAPDSETPLFSLPKRNEYKLPKLKSIWEDEP